MLYFKKARRSPPVWKVQIVPCKLLRFFDRQAMWNMSLHISAPTLEVSEVGLFVVVVVVVIELWQIYNVVLTPMSVIGWNWDKVVFPILDFLNFQESQYRVAP